MFKQIKEFFTGKPAAVVAEVPYKVEAVPAATEATTVPEQAIEAMVKSVAPAKKSTVRKPPAEKKPRIPKATK